MLIHISATIYDRIFNIIGNKSRKVVRKETTIATRANINKQNEFTSKFWVNIVSYSTRLGYLQGFFFSFHREISGVPPKKNVE